MSEKGLGSVKVEKVTLWVATETYGLPDGGGLDRIMSHLGDIESECKILGGDSEDYELIPSKTKKENN
jgi:hypothetical protein